MVIPVLSPHGLLFSKAVSLFHGPILTLENHNLRKTTMPPIGSIDRRIPAPACVAAHLATSDRGTQQDAAASIIGDLAVSEDVIQQGAAASIGERAASDTQNAAAITAMFNGVADDPDALANLDLPQEVIIREIAPTPGEQGWQLTGSPAPIDQILTRFSSELPGAHIEVVDVDTLPSGVRELPGNLVVNSLFTLTPENFQTKDMVANHVTFFVEKAWLDDNGIHPWAIQFNRYDDEEDAWVPLLGKLVGEDNERIFYTVSPPAFSLWAITGATEVPSVRFRAIDLRISPELADAGQEVQIEVQVFNLTSEPAEYNAVLWLNGQVHTSQNVVIGSTATETVIYTVQLELGDYAVRVGKLSGSFTVTPLGPLPTPVATPEPTPVATPEPAPVATPRPAPAATPEPAPAATPVPAATAVPPTQAPVVAEDEGAALPVALIASIIGTILAVLSFIIFIEVMRLRRRVQYDS